jgi:hypothetical protein
MSTTEPEVTDDVEATPDAKDDSAHEALYGAVRTGASDYADAHVSWTSQSGAMFPVHEAQTTHFHPLELPDPEVIAQAGLMPIVYPAGLIDADHETQPPSANIPLDHPSRAKNRKATLEAGKHPNPQVELALEAALAQKQVGSEGAASGEPEG